MMVILIIIIIIIIIITIIIIYKKKISTLFAEIFEVRIKHYITLRIIIYRFSQG